MTLNDLIDRLHVLKQLHGGNMLVVAGEATCGDFDNVIHVEKAITATLQGDTGAVAIDCAPAPGDESVILIY